ncbi:hypothetical protein QFZ67_000409 [Streptomyces sp. V1I1]|nr:hypothetical protein [Streptomyces sp. V1I1]
MLILVPDRAAAIIRESGSWGAALTAHQPARTARCGRWHLRTRRLHLPGGSGPVQRLLGSCDSVPTGCWYGLARNSTWSGSTCASGRTRRMALDEFEAAVPSGYKTRGGSPGALTLVIWPVLLLSRPVRDAVHRGLGRQGMARRASARRGNDLREQRHGRQRVGPGRRRVTRRGVAIPQCAVRGESAQPYCRGPQEPRPPPHSPVRPWAPRQPFLDGVLISVIEHVSCVRCGVLVYGRRLPIA